MTKKIFSWILFIPISITATFLAIKIFYYLNKLTDFLNGFDNNGWFSKIYTPIIYGIITGFVFVYVGTIIVPKFEKYVSLFLAFLISVITITAYFKGWIDYYKLAGLHTIIVVISSFFTAFRFYDENESQNF